MFNLSNFCRNFFNCCIFKSPIRCVCYLALTIKINVLTTAQAFGFYRTRPVLFYHKKFVDNIESDVDDDDETQYGSVDSDDIGS